MHPVSPPRLSPFPPLASTAAPRRNARRRLGPTRPRAAAMLLVLAAAVPAQGVGTAMVRLRAMEVTGLAAFSRDDVAQALLHDATTVAALQRPLDAAAAEQVAARVRELHRRAGYARAEATGRVVENAVHVALDAGPRFRCGEVRCTGNVHVPTAALAERLARRPAVSTFGTEAEKSAARAAAQRAWVAGEHATMDQRAAERALRLVTEAYRDVGRYGVRAAVEFVPDGERMVLAVAIEHEGHEVHVRGVKLDGEQAAHADAVIAHVAFAPDTLATTAALASLRRELEATARYVHVDAVVADDAPALLDPLTVTVRLRDDAPAPDAVPARDAAQVQRALQRVAADFERGRALRVTAVLAEPVRPAGTVRVLAGPAEMRVGRDGLLLDAAQVQLGDAAPVRGTFGLGRPGVLLGCGERRAGWRFDAAAPIQLQVLTRMAPSGEMEVRWGVGLSTATGALLDVTLHPATARQLLTRASAVQRDGDVLTLRFGECAVRIGPDGTLLDPELTFAVGPHRLAVSWANDGLGALDAGGDPAGAGTLASFAATLAAIATDRIPDGPELVRPLLREAVTAAVEGIGAAIVAAAVHSAGGEPPPLGESPAKSTTGAAGLLLARFVARRDSVVPVTNVCGGFACVLLDDRQVANAFFHEIASDRASGPLTLAVTSLAWELLGNERSAAAFRRPATEQWSLERCSADAAALAASFPSLRALPARIGARWRALPELRELLGTLPDGEAGDVQAWQKGVEHVWNAGGGARLRTLLLGG